MEQKLKQRRHYECLQALLTMASTVPVDHQQRLTSDLLSGLANALLDQTIFAIVSGLQEIQEMTERDLHESRRRLVQRQKMNRLELLKNHRQAVQENQARPHNIPIIERQHQKNLKAFDETAAKELDSFHRRIVLELDDLVKQQQTTLEKAGVPGFYITSNPQDIQIQIHLLTFMNQLASAQLST